MSGERDAQAAGRSAALSWTMPVAHVLVAMVCAWWLERGETALVTVLVLLSCSLAGLWRTTSPVLTATAPLRPAPAAGEEPRVLAWALSHRGPPHQSEAPTTCRPTAARPAF